MHAPARFLPAMRAACSGQVPADERTDRLVVAQAIGPDRYRTLSVAMDGAVTEDRFAYPERCSPSIRADLIRNVVPHPIGYCSDVLAVWPSFVYPVLYPWISGFLGVVFVAIGGVRIKPAGRGQSSRRQV